MRLLGSGFTTAATTIAGTTAGSAGGVGGRGANVGFTVQKITAFAGGSTAAPGSSGAIKFRFTDRLGSASTLIVLPGGSPDARTSVSPGGYGMSITLEDLDIQCDSFDADVTVAGQGGYGIFVFGE